MPCWDYHVVGPNVDPGGKITCMAVSWASIVENTTLLPHHDGGLTLLSVNAKKITRVDSAKPRSRPDDVR